MKKILKKFVSIKNVEENKLGFYTQINILGRKIRFWNTYKTLIKFFYIYKTYELASQIHPETFERFRGIYRDKSIVLAACGPTLTYFDFYADSNIYVGVNRAFLYEKIKLNYLFIQDYLKGLNDMDLANRYEGSKCIKFYGKIPECRAKALQETILPISYHTALSANASFYVLEDTYRGDWNKIIDKEPLADWGGCVFSALQFILFTNAKRIYLVGCDCSNKGHFHQEPPGENPKITSDLTVQYDSWLAFKNYCTTFHIPTEIISVNPIGLRGIFKDVYTQSFVDEHPELLNEDIQIITDEDMTK